MPINNATNRYSNSRYIVDNVTPGCPFTTIQSAINAAQADGGNAEIWVRQGTYTENLTLYDGINIEGAEQTISIIIGTHVPPTSGSCRFTRVKLQSATHIFSSAAAGTCLLSCLRCQFALTNGYVYNLANWTGELRIRWCTDYSTHNGLVYNTAGAQITINHSLVGKGTTSVFTANGNCTLFSVSAECPFLFNGTGTSVLEGGSVFGNNIATANTHTLTMAQVRIASGSTQAITHNSASSMILNEVIVNTSNATAIGGTGPAQMMSLQFPTSNVIAGTITQSLVGVTKTAEMWSDNVSRMKDTGFYSWAAAGPYFNDATLGTFKLLVGGTGYIKGVRVTWVAQNYVGMTAGNTYFIYIDSTGTIGAATTHTDALYEDNIVLFECLRDSTPVTNNQVTVRENHPYSFQTASSNYLHDVVGPVIQNINNGANITLNGTQKIQINGADVLSDHGLDTTIPDSGGVAVTWNKKYTTAAGKWALQNTSDTFSGFYNNAGTPTALGANKFGVYTLYASKDNLNTTTPTYFAVLDTSQYNNVGSATTAISNGTTAKASNELALLELAQLGYIVYSQASNSITNVIISKTTLRSTTSTAGTNQASLVNTNVTAFNGWLSSADTNVQSSLDTLDDLLIGGTAGQIPLSQGAAAKPSYVTPTATAGGNLAVTTNAATLSYGISAPVTVANGGTNATTFATSGGVVKYDGTRLVTSSTATYSAANVYNNTAQPAFLCYQPSDTANATGDGTEYTIGSTTALTEVFDQAGDMNVNGTFTAPVTGLYQFNASVEVNNLGSSHTAANMRLVTTINTYEIGNCNPYAVRNPVPASAIMCGSIIVPMTATNTATLTVTVNGGTKVVGIKGTSAGVERTCFSGFLVC